MTVALTLYLRHGCHLCEDMQRDLTRMTAESGLIVTGIDIDTDPALRERYNTLVPVLALGGREICHHFLDPEALRRAIDASAKSL